MGVRVGLVVRVVDHFGVEERHRPRTEHLVLVPGEPGSVSFVEDLAVADSTPAVVFEVLREGGPGLFIIMLWRGGGA